MRMSETTRGPARAAAGFTMAGVAGLVGLAGCTGTDGPVERDTPSAGAAPGTPSPAAGTPGGQRYRDGEYTASGWYGGLPSHIVVDLTLRDDVIAAVEVTPTATNETSLELQERFASAVADEVVGRPVDEVELDYLAGSSGTTQGFNDALEQIRAQAAG